MDIIVIYCTVPDKQIAKDVYKRQVLFNIPAIIETEISAKNI